MAVCIPKTRTHRWSGTKAKLTSSVVLATATRKPGTVLIQRRAMNVSTLRATHKRNGQFACQRWTFAVSAKRDDQNSPHQDRTSESYSLGGLLHSKNARFL